MRLTPPPLRGTFYQGLITKSCFAYDPCPVCGLCKTYDRTSAMCTICEGRKPEGFGHHCTCTEKQREVSKALEARLNRQLSVHQGQTAAPIDMQVPLDQVNEDLYKQIKEEFHVDSKVV